MDMSRRSTSSASAKSEEKTKKKQKKSFDDDELVDRISNLPDSVICYILSFLPTKAAVATNLLSIRWKFLWTGVPTLDFSDRARVGLKLSDRCLSFERFVNNVLLNNTTHPTYKFRLQLWDPYNPSHVYKWVSNVIARDLCVLSLCLGYGQQQIQLPSSLFTSQRLESLELSRHFAVELPISVSLPMLVTLKLRDLYYGRDESVVKIISGCPKLTSLYIRRNQLDNVVNFTIASSSLRYLDYDAYRTASRSDIQHKLEIDAPSLEHLHLSDEISVAFKFTNLNSLVHVSPDIFKEDFNYITSAVEVVQSFSSAKTLTLKIKFMQALKKAGHQLSVKLPRLTKLKVNTNSNLWSVVQNLLDCSDNLEILHYKKDYCYDPVDDHKEFWREPSTEMLCLLSLKEISMKDLDATEDELEMIRYFLKHGRVLETVEVGTDDHVKIADGFKMVRKMLMFTRRSHMCKISHGDISSYGVLW